MLINDYLTLRPDGVVDDLCRRLDGERGGAEWLTPPLTDQRGQRHNRARVGGVAGGPLASNRASFGSSLAGGFYCPSASRAPSSPTSPSPIRAEHFPTLFIISNYRCARRLNAAAVRSRWPLTSYERVGIGGHGGHPTQIKGKVEDVFEHRQHLGVW
jgi:hypothetical protein